MTNLNGSSCLDFCKIWFTWAAIFWCFGTCKSTTYYNVHGRQSKNWTFAWFFDPVWSWHQAFLDFFMDSGTWISVLSGVFKESHGQDTNIHSRWLALSYISSNDCSFVAFLSKISSDFASLQFILIVALQFLKADMLNIMTKNCHYWPDAKPSPWSSTGVFRGGIMQYCCLSFHWKGAQHDFQLKWLLHQSSFCPMKEK